MSRLVDVHGNFTVSAGDNTGYSLTFSGGIISVADDSGHIVAEFDADDAPVCVIEPERKGRWLDGKPRPYCSECGEECLLDGWHFPCKSKRCPSCGVPMQLD